MSGNIGLGRWEVFNESDEAGVLSYCIRLGSVKTAERDGAKWIRGRCRVQLLYASKREIIKISGKYRVGDTSKVKENAAVGGRYHNRGVCGWGETAEIYYNGGSMIKEILYYMDK